MLLKILMMNSSNLKLYIYNVCFKEKRLETVKITPTFTKWDNWLLMNYIWNMFAQKNVKHTLDLPCRINRQILPNN